MFMDKVDIYVKAGRGGNGCVSFRREKYVAKGGPDGGDGGRGGNVVFVVDPGENTLIKFKYRRKFAAENGADGQNRKFHGKNGEDIVIPVPAGTVIREKQTGRIIRDLSSSEPFVVARGGKGGWGNTHFATATRQAPRFARSGLEGEELELTLELKMIADVGLVGYPNVGKSTLLSRISSARPKIANYHFTTLSPNLGVAEMYGESFVVADIPGLIDGASEGVGLGHDFLRHIERCRLIVHVVDISASERPDPLADIIAINTELASFSAALAEKEQIFALNKTDLGYDPRNVSAIESYAAENGCKVYLISAASMEGVNTLLETIASKLPALPPVTVYEPDVTPEMYLRPAGDGDISVKKENGVYSVTGDRVKKLISEINFDDSESLSYFQRALRSLGIIDMLEQAGIEEGETVEMYGLEFDFYF